MGNTCASKGFGAFYAPDLVTDEVATDRMPRRSQARLGESPLEAER